MIIVDIDQFLTTTIIRYLEYSYYDYRENQIYITYLHDIKIPKEVYNLINLKMLSIINKNTINIQELFSSQIINFRKLRVIFICKCNFRVWETIKRITFDMYKKERYYTILGRSAFILHTSPNYL